MTGPGPATEHEARLSLVRAVRDMTGGLSCTARDPLAELHALAALRAALGQLERDTADRARGHRRSPEAIAEALGRTGGSVTLTWDDPDDAARFLDLRRQRRQHGWLPDGSREELLALVGTAEIVKDGSEGGERDG
jgi:hypothetical protein